MARMTEPRVTAIRSAIEAAEIARRAYLVAGQFERLSELLHPALRYIHGNGMVHDCAGYLAHVAADFRMTRIEGELPLIECGQDWALVSGPVANCLIPKGSEEERRFPAIATLLWVETDRWRLLSYQGSPLPN